MAVIPAPNPAVTLRVLHETAYAYDAPVELAHHLGHLRPRATPLQRVCEWQLSVTPQPDVGDGDAPQDAGESIDPSGCRVTVSPGVHQSVDPWGNHRASFSHSRVHDRLVVVSSFVVEIDPLPTLRPEASPPWEAVAARLRYRPGAGFDEAVEFTLGSAYAPREATLARFATRVFRPGTPLLAGALSMMHLIFRYFAYKPLATSVNTRAPEALAQRQGVCQDFAHVMIGAMRSIGLAARYVSGYLLTHPPPGQPRLIGADASHAWVSVWCPVHGWVALDPTNAVLAGTDHVTLAWGRDYADVAPLRGVIRGGGRAEPRVAVTVAPLEAVFDTE
ncbi:transglutaminase family protein [uncultured Sphaerotilus sp.]|uniref:transglutaminase family protein n=1 Tax=uncultured Sphaerotilus sp. TaxID=474984 RepID=UPI0030CA1D2A